jgi:serine/threonine protein kinase
MEGNTEGSDLIVGGQYQLVTKIGWGAFGKVYRAKNIKDGEVRYIFNDNISVEVRKVGIAFILQFLHNVYRKLQ